MPNDLTTDVALTLRAAALAYPGAVEDFPWGDRCYKVKGKIFLFLMEPDGGLGVSLKLPASNHIVLMFPFATPTGYGLGKAGWVSLRFAKGEAVDVQTMLSWLDESYRAIAPKKLVAQLGG